MSLEQNSVAGQRAALAQAAGVAATDAVADKASPRLRQAGTEHRQRVREAQGGLGSS